MRELPIAAASSQQSRPVIALQEERETSMTNATAAGPAKCEAARECEWTPSLAECLAQVFGIGPLSASHWRVISECREERASHGRTPELATLAARAHMSVPQLESLFPTGQTVLVWILAGVEPPPVPPAASAETLALPRTNNPSSESTTRPEADSRPSFPQTKP